jgi:hypothetical protein
VVINQAPNKTMPHKESEQAKRAKGTYLILIYLGSMETHIHTTETTNTVSSSGRVLSRASDEVPAISLGHASALGPDEPAMEINLTQGHSDTYWSDNFEVNYYNMRTQRLITKPNTACFPSCIWTVISRDRQIRSKL